MTLSEKLKAKAEDLKATDPQTTYWIGYNEAILVGFTAGVRARDETMEEMLEVLEAYAAYNLKNNNLSRAKLYYMNGEAARNVLKKWKKNNE